MLNYSVAELRYKTIVNMYNGEIRYNENKENSDTF